MVRSLIATALLFAATTASASIVVFTDGRAMKIASYTAMDDTVDLTLQSGGKLSMPSRQVP